MVEQVSQSISYLKGCFYPRLCWKTLSNQEPTANTVSATKEETNYVFLHFSKQTFKKRNITFTEKVEPVPLLKSHVPVLFITGRKWISTIRKSVTS